MAYSSSRGGSSRGGSGRSGGGGSRGVNATAYGVAAVLVVLVIVVVMVLGGKKKPTTSPTPIAPPAAPPAVVAPSKPGEPPYPVVAESLVAQAREIVRGYDADYVKAKKLYEESLKAKEKGDDAAWQSKLAEARTLLEGIKRGWNDFIDRLPSNRDHDTEEVARHYFARENGQVQTMTKLLAAMKSDQR